MRAERGFTLLEVMVALAIFALLAAAILTASQWVVRQRLQVEERVLGTWVLDNRLQELRLQGAPAPEPGTCRVAMGGHRWRIEQQVERVPGQALWHVRLSAGLEGGDAQWHGLEAWLAEAP